MGWRKLLADLMQIWSAVGLCVAGLTAAYLVGIWSAQLPIVGAWSAFAAVASVAGVLLSFALGVLVTYFASVPPLREALQTSIEDAASKGVMIEELERRLTQEVTVENVVPPALPAETVQVWLRQVADPEQELSLEAPRIPTLLIANLKGGGRKDDVGREFSDIFRAAPKLSIDWTP